ncbi:MAG: hydroxyacylglutathione hydrolase, partial [Burkholderiaceae bacterium]
IVDTLRKLNLNLQSILVTHHHADHTGGVMALNEKYGAKVFAPALDTMPCEGKMAYQRLGEGDSVTALGIHWQVSDVPGHTAGHIAYFGEPAGMTPTLFCGDTLFSGGCGRLFEGTPAQMRASLAKLSALPGNTNVCCAHEYTLANLAFARRVEPGNTALMRYSEACAKKRENNIPTVPSSIAIECAVNPFLRVEQDEVMASVLSQFPGTPSTPDNIFGALREWKNTA